MVFFRFCCLFYVTPPAVRANLRKERDGSQTINETTDMSSQRKAEYQQFLKSPFWRTLRAECIERDGGKCRYCGRDWMLQAHHLMYPRDWYDTTLDMLLTLCRPCHKKEHGIKRGKRVRMPVVKAVEVEAPPVERTEAGPVKERRPPWNPSEWRIEDVTDMRSLNRARASKLITRAQFVEFRDKFRKARPPKPTKPPKVKAPKRPGWWVGMYEGVPNPADVVKNDL